MRPRTWAKGCCTLLLMGCLLDATSAQADDTNFRPYLVGARAAGMGGAFTALADDGSGSYYNPGGMAFSSRSSISLSGSVYGRVSIRYADLFAPGDDFSGSSINTFPVSTAGVYKVGPVDPSTGVSKNTLFFGVFLPDAGRIDDRDTVLNGVAKSNAFFLTQDSQTVWAGGGYARRFGRFGIGVTAFGMLTREITQIDLNAVDPTDATRFAAITIRQDVTTYGALGGLGVRYDPTDRLHLGLSVYTPSFGGGSRRYFARVLVGDDTTVAGAPAQAGVIARDDLGASPSVPLRVQAGAAYNKGRWTFSADAMLLGPRHVTRNLNLSDEGLEREIVRRTVVNGSLGMEYLARDRWPLRFGLFTDFAASPNVSPDSPSNSQHINRFGASASVGFRSTHVVTDVGFNVAYGRGQELVPLNLDFSQPTAGKAEQLLLYLFLSTAYEF